MVSSRANFTPPAYVPDPGRIRHVGKQFQPPKTSKTKKIHPESMKSHKIRSTSLYEGNQMNPGRNCDNLHFSVFCACAYLVWYRGRGAVSEWSKCLKKLVK